MVGLVIVSHSKNLAGALVELIRAGGVQDIPLIGVGGVGQHHKEFGTDGLAISEAIQNVFSPEGVLVLMDLGSAILNTEMAKDILPEEMQAHVRICSAPLVEGAVSAAVQIGLGSDLETVVREAQNALLPKAEQLSDTATPSTLPQVVSESDWSYAESLILTIPNQHGLHARPAAKFVKIASSFQVDVMVKNLSTGKGPVPATSLNSIATLGVRKDHQIEISARGLETPKVLEAFKQLAAENFGDAVPEPQKPQKIGVSVQSRIGTYARQGTPISEGTAIGCIQYYHSQEIAISDHESDDPDSEWSRFQEAFKATHQAIGFELLKIRSAAGANAADIFEAHLALLDDPVLLEKTRRAIYEKRFNAAWAWKASIDDIEQSYLELDDPYLQQRADDVRDVGNQLLHRLVGGETMQKIQFSRPAILLARELTPTQTAQLDMDNVLGIITQIGGPTSHSAILGRSLGVPAVVCSDDDMFALPQETVLGMNGGDGTIWINPAQEIVTELEQQKAKWLEERDKLYQARHQAAITKDGHSVEIAANIGNVAEAGLAVENGAESIGLLRSEFLYVSRFDAPSEDDQYQALKSIGDLMNDKPIIIRTLDVGGDKNIHYLKLPREENPFLGVRALRFCLQRPDVFKPQLRAILRATQQAKFRIMFPMVSTLEDLQRAREVVEETHIELEREGLTHTWPLEIGIMIETPAAVMLSPSLARQVDFFSIGTNDLTQYTFAADRGNQHLAEYSDALHPAILRLIQQVVDASHRAGKWTGVCGELAGNPLAIPILLGMGVDELSMNPGAIPKTKAIVRELDAAQACKLAGEVLEADTGVQVQEAARSFFTHNLPPELCP